MIASSHATNAGGSPVPPGLRAMAAVLSLPAILGINVLAREVADRETAGLVAAALPSTMLALLEWYNWRKQEPRERIEATVGGGTQPNPVIVAAYVVVALQLLQGALGFLTGLGVGAALNGSQVAPTFMQTAVLTVSAVIVVPVVAVCMVFIARTAAHRIEKSPLRWLAAALIANLVLNVLTAVVMFGIDETMSMAIAVAALVHLIYFGLGAIGVRWARKNQAAHNISRAYRELSPTDQSALMELVLPELRARAAGGAKNT